MPVGNYRRTPPDVHASLRRLNVAASTGQRAGRAMRWTYCRCKLQRNQPTGGLVVPSGPPVCSRRQDCTLSGRHRQAFLCGHALPSCCAMSNQARPGHCERI